MTTIEQAIHDRRKTLQNQYAYIDALEEINALKTANRIHENPLGFSQELDDLQTPVLQFDGIPTSKPKKQDAVQRKARSFNELERLAREVHLQIWANRKTLFPASKNYDPIAILDPILALELYNYKVTISGALGQMESSSQMVTNVAGIIDGESKQVLLSSAPSPVSRRFTAAHELGHALLHNGLGLHRDRPLDGARFQRDPIENEADKFAALFLMPEKLVKRVFCEMFGAAPFVLNEDQRFALSASMPSPNWHPRRQRDLSRVLSSATRYNGTSFTSIANRFGVSIEAMAIRLEQLKLV